MPLPPRPPGFSDGTFPPQPGLKAVEKIVTQFAMPAGGTVSAAISQGQNAFSVKSIDIFTEELVQPDPSDLPKPVKGGSGPGAYWQLDAAGSVAGGGPATIEAGDVVAIQVVATVTDRSIAPGPFTGTLTVTVGAAPRAIPLAGTYLGVAPSTPIARKYDAIGGFPVVGTATSNAAPMAVGGTAQQFDHGMIWDVPGKGTFFLAEAVKNKWLSPSVADVKTAAGNTVQAWLGPPVGDSFATPEKGTAQRFNGGVIVVRRSGATVVVYGAIYTLYATLGDIGNPAAQPVVGLPNADETSDFEQSRLSTFDAGVIYWSAATGAHEIHGDILGRYRQDNVEGNYGLPTSDEQGAPDGVGRFSNFEHGSIYWTPATGAHEIDSRVLPFWLNMGGPASWLGYPTGRLANWTYPGGRPGWQVLFQYGAIGVTMQDAPIAFPEEKSFSGQWTVPAPSAVGGNATLTVRSNGTWNFATNTKNTAVFESYKYSVRGLLSTPGGLHLAVQYSDSISAGGTRDDGDRNDNSNPADPSLDPFHQNQISTLQQNWPDVRNASFALSHDWEDIGVIGAAEGVVKDLAAWAIVGTVGGPLTTMLFLGNELGRLTQQRFVSPDGLLGVVVMATGIAILGPLGIAIAVFNLAFKHRQISDTEYAFANAVFRNTLPDKSRIVFTNASHGGGRKFTLPNIDGTYLVNLGDAYDSPTTYTDTNYPAPGQVLIHELTHVWQIYHNKFLPAFVCDVVTKKRQDIGSDDPYAYGGPTVPFNQFGVEQQAHIVDDWFGSSRHSTADHTASVKREDPNDPFFKYILNNIWAGQS